MLNHVPNERYHCHRTNGKNKSGLTHPNQLTLSSAQNEVQSDGYKRYNKPDYYDKPNPVAPGFFRQFQSTKAFRPTHVCHFSANIESPDIWVHPVNTPEPHHNQTRELLL